MKIKVTKNEVKVLKENTVNTGEYNVNKCHFEFSDEYTDELIKIAVFNDIEVPIFNDECDIPTKILNQARFYKIGVYAYETVDNELVLRYSPKYALFEVNDGSFPIDSKDLTEEELNRFDYCMATIDRKQKDVQELIDDLNDKVDNDFFKGKSGKDGINGVDGKNGEDGENGATFIPSIDEEGNLSWINDKDLDNPSPINIKGADGKDGERGIQGDKGDSFTYEDFTEEQLESLRGPKGDKGEQGNVGPQGEPGKDGINGTNGQDGYTPVKGTDYWTEEDITSIKDYCTSYIDENITQVLGGSY